ncbi:MAG TPA: aspartate aminotransferase family protein [Terriglobia bacterium]|nr:aspartate aminotransferase family protein [Terriglobia bacterium]
MAQAASSPQLEQRVAPLEMSPEEFRAAGHQLVDRIAEFLGSIPRRPVTPAEAPRVVRQLLEGATGDGSLPERGGPPQRLLEEAADLLFEHSLLSGHPRFWGYIYSSAAPVGALGDLLASAVNPNLGAWNLSPIGTEIEAQTIRWIAELIGYPTDCGGILVSGGNMANFVPFLVARKARANWDVSAEGLLGGEQSRGQRPQLRVYCSAETHTWIDKASDLFGLGTESVRWIPVDDQFRMDTAALRKQIDEDTRRGDLPFLVVGTAGSVSTGAIDPLAKLAAICRDRGLWFHVDGAYGAVAAALPDASADLRALREADSVAVDPHKWLYAPVEAGCVLVRDAKLLPKTFSHRPPYYHLVAHAEDEVVNYFEYGMQNSRAFRALKVWLGLRQVGRQGCVQMIADDIRLAEALYRAVSEHPELEAFTQALSITTFRYVPSDLKFRKDEEAEEYLNRLNAELLTRLQQSGEAFVTNAVIRGRFVLRACIVNFRTRLEDVRALPGIVVRIGREVDRALRSKTTAQQTPA